MNIGCLFGTFDPPHVGHVAIAEYMRDHSGLDEVWLVVTPLSPFKLDQVISAEEHRVAMAQLAAKGRNGLRVSEDELRLPQPNYTAHTLEVFRKRWPEHRFALIIGSDNLAAFDRWRDPGSILAHHRVLVYPRPGSMMHIGRAVHAGHPGVSLVDAPLMEHSSSRIRQSVRQGKDVRGRIPDAVLAYIQEHRLYSD